MGVVTTNLSEKLTVNGDIRTSGDVCMGGGKCLNSAATGGGFKTYAGQTIAGFDCTAIPDYTARNSACVSRYGTGARVCIPDDFINGVPQAYVLINANGPQASANLWWNPNTGKSEGCNVGSWPASCCQ